MTVAELLDRMTSQEVAEWRLYDQIRAAEHESAAKLAAKQKQNGR